MNENGSVKLFSILGYIMAFIINTKLAIAVIIALMILLIMIITIKIDDEETEDIMKNCSMSEEYASSFCSMLIVFSSMFTLIAVSLYNIFVIL